jgi:hypothetical protein
MRVHHILSILVLSVLICGAARACAGGDEPDREHIAQWVKDRTAAADHVFLARTTLVKRSGRIPALDTTAEFELLEMLKGGAPQFAVLSISECQDFELKENDVRVFFVTNEGMILFPDYRRLMSDSALLTLLRAEPKRNAN